MELDRRALDHWITREDTPPEPPFPTAFCPTHDHLEPIRGAALVSVASTIPGRTPEHYGAQWRVTLECGRSTTVIGTGDSVRAFR